MSEEFREMTGASPCNALKTSKNLKKLQTCKETLVGASEESLLLHCQPNQVLTS